MYEYVACMCPEHHVQPWCLWKPEEGIESSRNWSCTCLSAFSGCQHSNPCLLEKQPFFAPFPSPHLKDRLWGETLYVTYRHVIAWNLLFLCDSFCFIYFYSEIGYYPQNFTFSVRCHNLRWFIRLWLWLYLLPFGVVKIKQSLKSFCRQIFSS